MNTIATRFQKIIWALALISSLGASVYLSFTSLKFVSPSTTNFSETPGWSTIYTFDQKIFYYNNKVGLVMPAKESRQNLLRFWSENSKIWGFIQLAAVSIGLILAIIKRPAAIKPIHRLNIAFGYLAITWLSAFWIAFRMRDTSLEIPPGYMLIAPPSGQVISARPDAVVLIMLGIGFSLVLGYAFIRWARANSPEEVFA